MPEPRVIVKALIRLNRLENEFKFFGERPSKRKGELESLIAAERNKIPPPILGHHNRLRSRGRDSTAPVRDWVCRSCFITVASGMRTHLMHRDDLHVCANCASYSYVTDSTEDYPDDTQLLNAARTWAAKAEKKKKPAKKTAVRKPVRSVVVRKTPQVKPGIKLKKKPVRLSSKKR